MLGNARFIGGEPPSAEIVFGQSPNGVNQFVQTPRRVNSSAFSLVTGWRKNATGAASCTRQLGKKKKKRSRTTNTTTLAAKRYESLDLPTVTRLGVKRRRRGLLTENKQRCTQSISRKPNSRQKKKIAFLHPHIVPPVPVSGVQSHVRARAAGVPTVSLSRGCRVSAAV